MPTSNLPNGITNAVLNGPLSTYVAPDPSKCHIFFDDFDRFYQGTGTAGPDWLVTTNGTTSVATLLDADGGILSLTTDTVTANAVYAQWQGSQGNVIESYTFESGKRLWCKARFKVDVATGAGWITGLAITDTSPLDAADGVYFLKAAGSALLNLIVVNSGASSTTVAVGTMADDTYVEVGYLYNGADRVDVYLNNNRVGGTTTVANVPSTELAVTFGMKNNNANARTGTIDYLFFAKERDTEIS